MEELSGAATRGAWTSFEGAAEAQLASRRRVGRVRSFILTMQGQLSIGEV